MLEVPEGLPAMAAVPLVEFCMKGNVDLTMKKYPSITNTVLLACKAAVETV